MIWDRFYSISFKYYLTTWKTSCCLLISINLKPLKTSHFRCLKKWYQLLNAWKSTTIYKNGGSFWKMINPYVENGETRKPTGLKNGGRLDFHPPREIIKSLPPSLIPQVSAAFSCRISLPSSPPVAKAAFCPVTSRTPIGPKWGTLIGDPLATR